MARRFLADTDQLAIGIIDDENPHDLIAVLPRCLRLGSLRGDFSMVAATSLQRN